MTASSPASVATFIACAICYTVLIALILLQARRSATGLLLAGTAATTVLWSAASAMPGVPAALCAALDLLHVLAWYGFCLHLYRRPAAAGPGGTDALFACILLVGAAGSAAAVPFGRAGLDGTLDLLSPAILLRLGLAISQVLLLENYWRSHAPEQGAPQRGAPQRGTPERPSHVGLACVALGSLAAYDVMVCADAALSRFASPTLVAGRGLVAILVMPLLALAAARNRDWRIDIHVSRTAAFHSATLIVSGVFLLSLAAAGELARHFAGAIGIGWGGLAEICLMFAGVITVASLLTSAPARAALRRVIVDHFFTHRYDYRREWQHCIDILTKAGAGPLPERVIRALADAVDSPAGLLFMREAGQAGFAWAGAWNTAPAPALPIGAAALAELAGSDRAMELPAALPAEPGSFAPWLAVPLREPGDSPAIMGVILLARPRAKFAIDAEVLSVLRILAHEVAIHLAQARATADLLRTRDLREYGERFAFVAHDIKNVSSQLSLLLSNAETHLADPDFQKDMLATVRASVARIGGLIRRLEPARAPASPALLDPAKLLASLVSSRPPSGDASLALDIDASAEGALITMEEAAFQAAVGHLLDNALNAVRGGGHVQVTLRATRSQVAVDIADDGPGMTPEFVRDQLFAPFASRTPGGTGLGAFQARALLHAAGGALTVASRPGCGTTMGLLVPRAAASVGGVKERERVLF